METIKLNKILKSYKESCELLESRESEILNELNAINENRIKQSEKVKDNNKIIYDLTALSRAECGNSAFELSKINRDICINSDQRKARALMDSLKQEIVILNELEEKYAFLKSEIENTKFKINQIKGLKIPEIEKLIKQNSIKSEDEQRYDKFRLLKVKTMNY